MVCFGVGLRGPSLVWALAFAGSALGFAVPAAAQEAAGRSSAASSEAVTAPELVSFVEAEYPAQARAKGITGDVTLALGIDEQGRVTDVEVVEGAGHGFDEAAVAAVRRFVFRPARRGERPVKSRIAYRYRFHLDAAPVPAAKAPTTGVLRGRVLIENTQTPLAGARVRVLKGSELVLERSTDGAGRFAAENLPPGAYTVSVEADGFEPYSAEDHVSAGEEVAVDYRVVTKSDEAEDIVVRGARPKREVTRRTVSRRELTRVPGTSGDALRGIQSLPGVARPPALSGILVVRGNADQTSPVFVDGMWLPRVYHLGGLSAVVPTEMLDEISFYPGNFGVRYGRALAGVVDAHLRETRDDGRYHGMLQLDLIDVRGIAEGPIPLVDGWNFIAGFRRSHVDAWLTPLLEGEDSRIEVAPVYYDFQLMADTRPTKRSYLRIAMLGADDRFRAIDESSAGGGAADAVDSSLGVGVIYHNTISEDTRAELTMTVARQAQRFAVSTLEIDLVAYGMLGRGELTHRVLPNATLRTGYDLLLAPYSVKGQLPEEGGAGAPDVGSALTNPTRTFDENNLFFQPAVYAELSTRASRRLELVSGVRVDYTFDTQRLDVSPRLTGRYQLSPTAGTTLKAGTGLFTQAPGVAEIVLSEDPTALRSTRNFQNSLGIEQRLGDQVELSVEGFFYLLDDLISRGPDENGVLRYDNAGRGRIFGGELMLRYLADDDFFGWISYTLSRSERTHRPGLPSQLFYLDQPHVFTALGSYNLGRGWEIGARFRLTSGNLYTPCRGGLYSSLANSYLCISGAPNSERLPPFHQLDIRVDKRWVFANWNFGIYLDLINAYNRINSDYPSFNFDYSQQRASSQGLPIVPSIGLRGEF